MGDNGSIPVNFDMQKAMQLAATPAGRELVAFLQSHNSQAMQNAMNKAAAGAYTSAKQALSSLLEDPEIRELLKQLEGAHGGNGR